MSDQDLENMGDRKNDQPAQPEQPVEARIPHPYIHKCDRGCEAVVKLASERIHDLIAEENGLQHNRMTWFANIEGFLWLSFAAAISNQVGWENGFWLMVVIPIIGILVCLSAISAIQDADHAIEMLLKNWSVIQSHHPEPKNSIYTEIPVIGLSKKDHPYQSIPRWHFALFVLVGWSFGLVGVVVTKIDLCVDLPWQVPALPIIFVVWFVSLAGVMVALKSQARRRRKKVVKRTPQCQSCPWCQRHLHLCPYGQSVNHRL
jgi:hypothetical protein